MLKEGRGKKNRGEEEQEDLEVAESSAGFGIGGGRQSYLVFKGQGLQERSKGVSKPLRLYNYFFKMYFSLPWCKFSVDRDSVCFVHHCT